MDVENAPHAFWNSYSIWGRRATLLFPVATLSVYIVTYHFHTCDLPVQAGAYTCAEDMASPEGLLLPTALKYMCSSHSRLQVKAQLLATGGCTYVFILFFRTLSLHGFKP